MTIVRLDGRRPDETRPVKIATGIQPYAEGSAFIEVGSTNVVCAASVQEQSDFNVVITESGRFVEFQGTAEGAPFDDGQMKRVIEMARKGFDAMFAAQRSALQAIRSNK